MKRKTKALCAFGALAAIFSPVAALCDESFDRALSLVSEARYAEAREVLDPLLEREPGHPRARLLHGILRARAGRVDEAIDIFETLRRDHPDMSEPYNNLAVLHAVQGRLDDAREILLVALERAPAPVMYANLGAVHTKLARRAYRKAREAGSDSAADQGMHTAFTLPETPNGSPETEPRNARVESQPPGAALRDTVTALEAPPMVSRDAGTGLREPAPEAADPNRPQDSATAPRNAAPGSREPAGEPGNAASGLRQAVVRETTEASRGPGEASAETRLAASGTESKPPVLCAHAGGFHSRRAVADAALWLQSYGAEVLEVRHEEHQIASSHRVYLPPFADREEAVAKLREIRRRGVGDVALITDGDLANGISFGIYKEAGNMHRRVAALDQLGYSVRSRAVGVEITEEYVIEARADGASDAFGVAWAARFPEQSIRIGDCL